MLVMARPKLEYWPDWTDQKLQLACQKARAKFFQSIPWGHTAPPVSNSRESDYYLSRVANAILCTCDVNANEFLFFSFYEIKTMGSNNKSTLMQFLNEINLIIGKTFDFVRKKFSCWAKAVTKFLAKAVTKSLITWPFIR